MLREGRIRVGGNLVRDGALPVSDNDAVEIDGNAFSSPAHIYLMLHKPKGVVSASEDGRDKTVVDLVPAAYRRDGLFPAGRLDKDTTGFVLITDDGSFAHRILSPKNHVDKTYLVTLRDKAEETYAQAFEAGISLGDGTACLPAKILYTDDSHVVRVCLHEGRYHQIKRMFAALGNAVTELHRESVGGIPLDDTLQPGECRPLTEAELHKLGL